MSLPKLRFEDHLTERPQPSGIDVVSKLSHFAIITYAVDPESIRPHVHPRFDLTTIDLNGGPKALISVVPFREENFSFAAIPWARFNFGQTNYRIYVQDRENGENCVWFLGTLLSSWVVAVPRYIWKLPWHPGSMDFACQLVDGRYARYELESESRWAPAHLSLRQPEGLSQKHPGFPDEETAMLHLTHPLTGYYFRRDGRLGSYKVWHQRLDVKPAELLHARFDLLHDMGIVNYEEQQRPYSVLLQPENEFTIYLPPVAVGSKVRGDG